MNEVTALILTYNREKNLSQIIQALRAQSVKCDIMLWDNGNNIGALWEKLVDVVFRTTKNYFCQPRQTACAFIKTRYVFTQDDDFMVTDNKLFEKLIALNSERPNTFFGVKGKNFGSYSDQEKPYQANTGWVDNGDCMMVNTGLAFFETRLMNRVDLNPHFGSPRLTDEEMQYGDDMYISASMPKCYAYPFFDATERLDECGHGLSHETPHMDVRNTMCKKYWLGEANG